MPAASLNDRAVLEVAGADARAFLHNLVTCDVSELRPGQAAFGALLTPQGKILFDFFLVCADEDRFFLDAPGDLVPALAKRLSMYKLRAKVTVAETGKKVVAVWGESGSPPLEGLAFRDPRKAGMGWRVIADAPFQRDGEGAYEAHRIALGVPQGGVDFVYGDAFPHDANMDILNGLSFTKGCYVGQEVVSRMKHRGTARRRIVRVHFPNGSPSPGSEIRAGEIATGTVGSVSGEEGLAAVRIDRVADAQRQDLTFTAAGLPVEFEIVPEQVPA